MNTRTLLASAASLALAAAPAAPATDTIAYWPFGVNGFSDVSGGGHDLASATVAESDAAYLSLDGTSQFLTTASALDLSGETAVTFECWARATGKKSGFGLLMASANPTVGTGGFVIYNTGRLQSQYRMTASAWQIDYTSSTEALGKIDGASGDGMWHHIAYVIDRSKTDHTATRLYLDGKQVEVTNDGTAGAVPALFNDTFHIGGGAAYAAGNNFFTGCIDDVRISRGALSPDEFLKYPTVGKAMRADSEALPVVAYWPFGGKGGKDATGNGFDLTISGVPMTAGTPSPSWADFAKTNYYNGNFPFSAFSKTGFTLECFAKSGSGSEMAGSLFETTTTYYNNTGAFQLRFESYYKTVTAYFLASGKAGSNPKYVQSPTTEAAFGALNDGKWRHYAVVYDPSKTGTGIVTLYVDGVAAPTTVDTADQGAFALLDAKLYIARRSISNDRGGAPFYGSIDDVRITAGVLTPDQFLSSRSANSTLALYRFDRETLEDQSGNDNDLAHCQDASVAGVPEFGDAGFAASGTGLVLSGNGGTKDWVKTAAPFDLTGTKAVTFEIDYNSETPTGSGNYFIMGSENPVAANGNVLYMDASKNIHAQTRKADGSAWRTFPAVVKVGTPTNGYQRIRYVVNGNNAGTSYYTVNVDGTPSMNHDTLAVSGLGSQALCLGHSPNYVAAYWMKGKILRAAVSDLVLGADEYVLDNLVLDTAKRTLAWWTFSDRPATDKSGSSAPALSESGTGRRDGSVTLDGTASAATSAAIDLSDLTQATVECFALFGETPESGTLFAMGSGAGSFKVAADAAAGTLSGAFVPYDHLAASCGGVAALATLAGKKAWHHVALVIDRTLPGADAVRFYVDYERATPAGRAWDAAARLLDGTLVVGADSSRASGFFTGRLDDLRVSAGALSPEEFLQPEERTEAPDAFTLIVR